MGTLRFRLHTHSVARIRHLFIFNIFPLDSPLLNMATKDKTTKTKRRRRVSGYIDIDHISDPPGDDYVNWRQITQRKLKERETKLMAVRIASLQTILAEQCKAFEAINSSHHKVTVPGSNDLIGKEVVSDCLEKLYLSLQ